MSDEERMARLEAAILSPGGIEKLLYASRHRVSNEEFKKIIFIS